MEHAKLGCIDISMQADTQREPCMAFLSVQMVLKQIASPSHSISRLACVTWTVDMGIVYCLLCPFLSTLLYAPNTEMMHTF